MVSVRSSAEEKNVMGGWREKKRTTRKKEV